MKKTDTEKWAALTANLVRLFEEAKAAGKPLRWLPDYVSVTPQNFTTGRKYRGINHLMLSILTAIRGWSSPLFAGLRQILALGGRVKREEFTRFSWVTLWQPKEYRKEDKDTGETEVKTYWFTRTFKVWNLDQCEGVKPEKVKGFGTAPGAETVAEAEAVLLGYCEAEGVTVKHGDGIPSYSPALDTIRVPEKEKYLTTSGYYRTLAHEVTHSTGRVNRLDRLQHTGFGTGPYAKEELVAQLGAAFLGADFGLTSDGEEERDAAYIASWLAVLGGDPGFVVDAAQKAQAAVDRVRKAAGVAEPVAVAVDDEE